MRFQYTNFTLSSVPRSCLSYVIHFRRCSEEGNLYKPYFLDRNIYEIKCDCSDKSVSKCLCKHFKLYICSMQIDSQLSKALQVVLHVNCKTVRQSVVLRESADYCGKKGKEGEYEGD